nr:MAG TPA: hypothetical protein [Caudoviricetes sp.]
MFICTKPPYSHYESYTYSNYKFNHIITSLVSIFISILMI